MFNEQFNGKRQTASITLTASIRFLQDIFLSEISPVTYDKGYQIEPKHASK